MIMRTCSGASTPPNFRCTNLISFWWGSQSWLQPAFRPAGWPARQHSSRRALSRLQELSDDHAHLFRRINAPQLSVHELNIVLVGQPILAAAGLPAGWLAGAPAFIETCFEPPP